MGQGGRKTTGKDEANGADKDTGEEEVSWANAVTGKEEGDMGKAIEEASGANAALKAIIAAQAARIEELEAPAKPLSDDDLDLDLKHHSE